MCYIESCFSRGKYIIILYYIMHVCADGRRRNVFGTGTGEEPRPIGGPGTSHLCAAGRCAALAYCTRPPVPRTPAHRATNTYIRSPPLRPTAGRRSANTHVRIYNTHTCIICVYPRRGPRPPWRGVNQNLAACDVYVRPANESISQWRSQHFLLGGGRERYGNVLKSEPWGWGLCPFFI